jgi:hypothetical protein
LRCNRHDQQKGVLLLGCFTGSRITVLERLREEPRKRDFLSMIFNFDKPETRNFTEIVRLLAVPVRDRRHHQSKVSSA